MAIKQFSCLHADALLGGGLLETTAAVADEASAKAPEMRSPVRIMMNTKDSKGKTMRWGLNECM